MELSHIQVGVVPLLIRKLYCARLKDPAPAILPVELYLRYRYSKVWLAGLAGILEAPSSSVVELVSAFRARSPEILLLPCGSKLDEKTIYLAI